MEHELSQTQSPFATEPIGRLIVKFAVSSVIALLVNSLYNIVDQIFIGNGVGYLGNGATNIVFPITIIALALAMMIGNGGAAYLSLKLGEGNVNSAKKGIGNAVTMVTAVSIVLATVFLLFINPILTLFGATDTLRPYALDYGWIIGIGLPFMMISGAINSMIRADGSPKYAMFSMVIGAVLNVILDAVFIFPLQMGVQGAAIATVIGQVASFVVSVAYLPRFKTVRLNKFAFCLDTKACGNIVVFGLSSFITQFAITIVMALTNNLLAQYGAQSVYGADIPLTATGIVMKVNQIMISILLGIATGAQPIIGFNYGAKNFHRVKKALEISLIASEIISVLAFLLFQFAPMSVISLFGSEDGLYNEFAVKAFRIFLMLCPLTGFQTVIAVYLQAVGKPVMSALLSLARQIIFFVPAALLLPLTLGVEGVLWTGPVADGLAFLMSLALLLYERHPARRLILLQGRRVIPASLWLLIFRSDQQHSSQSVRHIILRELGLIGSQRLLRPVIVFQLIVDRVEVGIEILLRHTQLDDPAEAVGRLGRVLPRNGGIRMPGLKIGQRQHLPQYAVVAQPLLHHGAGEQLGGFGSRMGDGRFIHPRQGRTVPVQIAQ